MIDQNFSISTEKFQGPLEALLNLIEARKMSVSEVSLSEVTDSYLAYVEKLPEMPLGETAQFILVASTLLLIKSRTLLPMLQLSEDERESVEELERRLARYALYRKIAKMLRREWGRAPLIFARRGPTRPAIFNPGESSVAIIASVAMRMLSLLPKPEALAEAVVAPILALEDIIVRLKSRLTKALRTRFSELTKSSDKHERIVYFLAMLELVRNGSVSATQEKLFEEITIEAEHMGAPKYG
ncbi:MAG: Segregation and condensation protein A [Candidatus Kaiserbacteria bacterium GW2011_GWB1_52_6]|uniref:Segregation and condensation protein A n=3 Tax=Candidatus Kaiseribacteriota TaxID=1752734 RepID=A0A0G1XL09_9BACT|nr:MAG: Segregation and condensation protein A [Candidatus Kaiserbacteria bacterium GW2011_GWA2_52_12]KKW28116.1 MAG: Segregation and condensation protein A [Candidatus Kaiserbacteria bacterium GW2011_GWB1_52_6]KKW31953.1 MAG: Segregation and condensation protein A [Candidatus Kaiserbacteria bacterium GW2011_GWC2_52_8b]